MINEEMIANLVKEFSAKLNAELMGDGAGRPLFDYSTFRSQRSQESLTPSTLEEVKRLTFGHSPMHSWPIRLIEVEPTPIYGPVRRHRRRRIQKKWLKRYGVGLVGYDYPMGDNVLIDQKRGVGYCHPHAARRIRQRTKEQPLYG